MYTENTMTKVYQTRILLVTTLLLLSLVHVAESKDESKGQAKKPGQFYVQGQVFCDTCRVQFITKASTFLKGATVRLECKERDKDDVTFSVEGITDDSGTYHLPVEGDHEDDICEINLVKSPVPECSEIKKEGFSKDVARVSLATNSGMASDVRLANPIGFMKKEPLAECKKLVEDLGILPDF